MVWLGAQVFGVSSFSPKFRIPKLCEFSSNQMTKQRYIDVIDVHDQEIISWIVTCAI